MVEEEVSFSFPSMAVLDDFFEVSFDPSFTGSLEREGEAMVGENRLQSRLGWGRRSNEIENEKRNVEGVQSLRWKQLIDLVTAQTVLLRVGRHDLHGCAEEGNNAEFPSDVQTLGHSDWRGDGRLVLRHLDFLSVCWKAFGSALCIRQA